MAKGDREILKADLDDGYTPLANLILEALAMAKMSGVQKGLCLFLFRRTYGWGIKEDEITLKEFAEGVNSSISYVSKQLKQLIEWNVVIRTKYEPGKTPAYTFNTRVAQWDKGCINVQGLSKKIKQGLYKCSKQGLNKKARVEHSKTIDTPGFEVPSKESIKEIYKDSTCLSNDKQDAERPADKPPSSNKPIIIELTNEYRSIPGIKNEQSDFSFIGGCYTKFGYDAVLEAIHTLRMRMEGGFMPDKPKIYLLGILKGENQDGRDIKYKRGSSKRGQKNGIYDKFYE